MQIVARTVAALYWFHPMVWSAWRRLCLESERACDDAVVMSEERTDYAEQLVRLAQRMSATPVQPILGMANRRDLSTRVAAVLDDRVHRGRAGFALAAGTVLALALVVGSVAPVRAVAKAELAVVTADDQSSARALVEGSARALDRGLHNAANAVNSAAVKELHEAGVKPSKSVEEDGGPQAPAEIAKQPSRSIFVIGEVRVPGKYLISGDVTLLEVIAKAGSLTANAGPVVTVQRRKDVAVSGAGTPAVPGYNAIEVVRVALDDLKEGRFVSDLALQDGDTVYVRAADRFYVTGFVRTPGSYVLVPKMTVLQAIAIAGGASETGSTQGIKIVRRVDDKSFEIDVSDDDLVEPNDTIRVRQRLE